MVANTTTTSTASCRLAAGLAVARRIVSESAQNSGTAAVRGQRGRNCRGHAAAVIATTPRVFLPPDSVVDQCCFDSGGADV